MVRRSTKIVRQLSRERPFRALGWVHHYITPHAPRGEHNDDNPRRTELHKAPTRQTALPTCTATLTSQHQPGDNHTPDNFVRKINTIQALVDPGVRTKISLNLYLHATHRNGNLTDEK